MNNPVPLLQAPQLLFGVAQDLLHCTVGEMCLRLYSKYADPDLGILKD